MVPVGGADGGGNIYIEWVVVYNWCAYCFNC